MLFLQDLAAAEVSKHKRPRRCLHCSGRLCICSQTVSQCEDQCMHVQVCNQGVRAPVKRHNIPIHMLIRSELCSPQTTPLHGARVVVSPSSMFPVPPSIRRGCLSRDQHLSSDISFGCTASADLHVNSSSMSSGKGLD